MTQTLSAFSRESGAINVTKSHWWLVIIGSKNVWTNVVQVLWRDIACLGQNVQQAIIWTNVTQWQLAVSNLRGKPQDSDPWYGCENYWFKIIVASSSDTRFSHRRSQYVPVPLLQRSQKRRLTRSSPVRARYGRSFVSSDSEQNFSFLLFSLCSISSYIQTRYSRSLWCKRQTVLDAAPKIAKNQYGGNWIHWSPEDAV